MILLGREGRILHSSPELQFVHLSGACLVDLRDVMFLTQLLECASHHSSFLIVTYSLGNPEDSHVFGQSLCQFS